MKNISCRTTAVWGLLQWHPVEILHPVMQWQTPWGKIYIILKKNCTCLVCYHPFKCNESLMRSDMCRVVSIGYKVSGNHILQFDGSQLLAYIHTHVSVGSVFRKNDFFFFFSVSKWVVPTSGGLSSLSVTEQAIYFHKSRSQGKTINFLSKTKKVCELEGKWFHHLYASGCMESVVFYC